MTLIIASAHGKPPAVVHGADMIEIRADDIGVDEIESLVPSFLKATSLPTVFTIRSVEEGGNFSGDNAHRTTLLRTALESKNPPKYIELTTGSIGKIQNCFKKDADLNLSASTGSSFEIDKGSGSINQMKVDLSTGAAIKIEKNLHINHLSLNASTGSTFESGNEVVIESSEVMVSSGASVDIYGTLEISGKVSSGGNIEVEKNTIRTDITTSTGGSLNVDC